jgi:hypothetical protein
MSTTRIALFVSLLSLSTYGCAGTTADDEQGADQEVKVTVTEAKPVVAPKARYSCAVLNYIIANDGASDTVKAWAGSNLGNCQ